MRAATSAKFPKRGHHLRFLTHTLLAAAGLAAVAGLAGSGISGAEAPPAPRTVAEFAKPRDLPAGAPRYSDVCFSSRFPHPQNPKDPHDTFIAAAAFHATRLDWLYSQDRQFIGKAKAAGYSVQCTVNATPVDTGPRRTYEKGRAEDSHGEKISAPWMPAAIKWACVNNPDYLAIFLANANGAIDAGADTLQMDDGALNIAATRWGGCFCSHCVAGFRQYVIAHATPEQLKSWGVADPAAFDYRQWRLAHDGKPPRDLDKMFLDFQVESVVEFFHRARREIDGHAGRHVVMSSNNDGSWKPPLDQFEFGVSELTEKNETPQSLNRSFTEALERGKSQVFTLRSDRVPDYRRTIAFCYASGGHLIAPWDVFMLPDKGPAHPKAFSPRLFMDPKEVADLYQFVRDHADLLDGCEAAAAAGNGLTDDRYKSDPPVMVPAATQLYALVRARPHGGQAPVVIHLVDWEPRTKALPLVLTDSRFFPGKPLHLKLWEPGKPPQVLAGRAAEGKTTVDVPPLEPWAILVVSPG